MSERDNGEIVDVAAEVAWKPLQEKVALLTVAHPQLLIRVSEYTKLVPMLLQHLSAGGGIPEDLLTDKFIRYLFNTILKGDKQCLKITKYLGKEAGIYILSHPKEEDLWLDLLPIVSDDFVVGAVDEW